ncbi:MFS transporter [Burkholderia multivorans]|uniref:MFS transporter n=1 Tax=Burkholderia multivorans TaxID=87883 RepID=UPI0020191524|nr:MFS transporter [Burkholderia multivorans]MCA8143507.1 MFS transporter [Burkholderia multivorans]MCO1368517.1 MFS transporter [Burkholderia multivorans]MCO1380408.1 MFS transporter [Burkholderia multivorans]MDN8032851.1 MFS transporter [Burkholderia multivorans]UQP21481.1 MFS transporter [Burkholderia multivorans]
MHVHTPGRDGTPQRREARFLHALILLSTVICGTLAPTVIGPVLPAMQQHFEHVPGIETLVPVVVTMPMFVLGALAMVIGAISDKIGRKRVLVGALVLYALAGTAPLYLDSIQAILASRALVGLAEAAAMTVSTSFIGDYFTGARRDRYAALQVTVASTSAFVFNLMGGVLGAYGWRAPFVAYALPLLLAPLVQIFIWDTRDGRGTLREAHAHAPDEAAFRPWLLALICLAAFGVGLVFMVVPVHLSFMLVQLGVHSTSAIGFAYAMNSVGIIAGTLGFGWFIASRYSVLQQFVMGTIVCGLGFVCMGAAYDQTLVTLGGSINGVGCGIVLPALVSWGLRSLPFSRRGFGTGAFTAAQFIGYFCSPIIVMGTVMHSGSRFSVVQAWGFALFVLAALCVAGSLLRVRRLKLG